MASPADNQTTLSGILLTSENIDIKGKHYIRFFGTGRDGPFEVILSRHKPSFFVGSSELGSLPKSIPCTHAETPLHSLSGESVAQVLFASNSDRAAARLALKNSEVQTYEADVKPPERVLMDRGVFGFVKLSSPEAVRHRGNLVQWIDPVIVNCDDDLDLQFSTLSIDIETGMKGQLFSIALHWQKGEDTREIVLMTQPPVDPKPIDGLEVQCYVAESELLKEFIKLTNQFDPDLIVGWNVVGFDLKFILDKMKKFNIRPLIGRNQSELRLYKAGMGLSAHVNGRVVLDVPQALRTNFFQYESFSLERVSQEVLGEGKLITSGVGKWDEIERQYFHEPELLAEYNMKDSVLVTRIMEKTGILNLLVKRSRISGLLLPRVGGSVAAFDHYMIPAFRRFGLVAPNVEDVPSGSGAAGGHVFEPSVGLHENVIVLDFRSLYPSIIMTFKIDPIALHFSADECHETPEGFEFSSSKHTLPQVITNLMQVRKSAKETKDMELSQAVKILMNSFYGVMGSSGCRFYHPDLPEAITSTGRFLLESSRSRLEELGYSVIYGDTDSVFVKLKEGDECDYNSNAQSLAKDLNVWLSQMIQAEYGLESHLEIEYEKYYSSFFLPPSRSGASGSKKRYVGLIENQRGESIHFTGMEYVRSDWTDAAKEFQYELYRRVFAKEEVSKWMQDFVRDLREGEWDAKLVYRKRLTKNPDEYTKTTPPHVKAARLILENDPKANLRRIEFVITSDGPVPIQLNPSRPDYTHYIDKQIKPLANTVLPMLGLDFDSLISGQSSFGF